MRKVILYGELAKRYGKEHSFSVRTATEAIQALCANFPGFRKYLCSAHQSGFGFKVFVGNTSLAREKDASLPSSDTDTIRIVPAVFGSGAVGRILIGAVLVVGGIIMSAYGVPYGAQVTALGASLILGGVAQLLTSAPKPNDRDSHSDGISSFIFGGPENTTQQGGAVPIGYGRMLVGSTVVSAGIVSEGT